MKFPALCLIMVHAQSSFFEDQMSYLQIQTNSNIQLAKFRTIFQRGFLHEEFINLWDNTLYKIQGRIYGEMFSN